MKKVHHACTCSGIVLPGVSNPCPGCIANAGAIVDDKGNVFGGAAARDEVRVDKNGFYKPVPPTGTFSS